jgi:hypothetical protein
MSTPFPPAKPGSPAHDERFDLIRKAIQNTDEFASRETLADNILDALDEAGWRFYLSILPERREEK